LNCFQFLSHADAEEFCSKHLTDINAFKRLGAGLPWIHRNKFMKAYRPIGEMGWSIGA
jgi:hypothetical protein